ncbi:MAG: trimeric intracellular cation channel family protein, partial [Limnohabitans sp.]
KRLDIVGVCVCGFLAAFGGVLRDLVCNEIPTLFRDHRPYAVCAFAGGISYAGLTWLGLADTSAIAACALVTTGLRCLTLWHDWRLPTQLS